MYSEQYLDCSGYHRDMSVGVVILMLGTRAENFLRTLSPGGIWQKVLVPQHDLLKSFGAPTTKFKIAYKVLVPLLQLYNSSHNPDIEQKKFQRAF